MRFALLRSAPRRTASKRSALLRFAPLSFAQTRSAPWKSGINSRFFFRHSFYTSTPCRMIWRCFLLAIHTRWFESKGNMPFLRALRNLVFVKLPMRTSWMPERTKKLLEETQGLVRPRARSPRPDR